jgi:hypothetical protein
MKTKGEKMKGNTFEGVHNRQVRICSPTILGEKPGFE